MLDVVGTRQRSILCGGVRNGIADLCIDVLDVPNIWTDGGRDDDLDASVGIAGAGAFVRSVPCVFDGRAWCHAQDLDLVVDASRTTISVRGCVQSVQRAGASASAPGH